ncbi:ABC transporter permease [Halopseudomonas salegens]|uniref:ABC-2 type transport system permease protein n=1 Tax=Halopseudomonas salegens TaxID=1434072 RepID=A0A1H2GU03_9GAMM|nr:ABC transporter permease [Halopseudomonas salegens]SDU23157.1 ABC-2 type transport system permease protein [Halopseudomonas salegens]
MTAFIAALRKELRLLLRDWHALLLLFLMPSAFVIIMSLALADSFGDGQQLQLKGYLVSPDTSSAASDDFLATLRTSGLFDLESATLSAPLRLSGRSFVLRVHDDFATSLDTPGASGLSLGFAAEMGARERELIRAAVQQAFARYYTHLIAYELGYDDDYAREELLREGFISDLPGTSADSPNAVQQNVSGWLIFAMFIIAIPLSTTVIQERSERTLMRLQTLGASLTSIYLAKLLPYGIVNVLQLMLMLALGAWLLPLLGARGLSLQVNLPALLLMGLATSFAALCMASLVATAARTVEQATVFSGGLNILLAAISGIMIPTFIMPPAMQTIAALSPMNWALEGFLEVLVRQGAPGDIAHTCFRLFLFGLLIGTLAAFLLKRNNHHG